MTGAHRFRAESHKMEAAFPLSEYVSVYDGLNPAEVIESFEMMFGWERKHSILYDCESDGALRSKDSGLVFLLHELYPEQNVIAIQTRDNGNNPNHILKIYVHA